MIPIVVTGASGRMGRMVIAAIGATRGVRLAAAVERPGAPELGQDNEAILGGLGYDAARIADLAKRGVI